MTPHNFIKEESVQSVVLIIFSSVIALLMSYSPMATKTLFEYGLSLVERGKIPDPLCALAIRQLLRQRLRMESKNLVQGRDVSLLAELCSGDIAASTDVANHQHYEVPTEFFQHTLGKRLKYSSCLWANPEDWSHHHAVESTDLDNAENAMFALTAERARISDGHTILDLGCGWGSLSLWLAEHYPQARIYGICNSRTQAKHIENQAKRRNIDRITIMVKDANDLTPFTDIAFDRVVSIEMMEHMRNWPRLLDIIGQSLAPEGMIFLHFFAHRDYVYAFYNQGSTDWMARNFFTGGIMPCENILQKMNAPVCLHDQWWVNGQHYAKTAMAWLNKLDHQRATIDQLWSGEKRDATPTVLTNRWRLFFLSVAQLFGFDHGQQWGVVHALMTPSDHGFTRAQ